MQTNFTPEQLADPDVAEADAILRRCVHCGLCTAVCPTYVLLGDERDSPRGRIYLIKDMLEGGGKVSSELKTHVDRCLSCLSCMTTCPSGVDYMHLVDQARTHIARSGKRSPKELFVRRLLANVLPYPERFRLAVQLAPLGRPWVRLLRRLGLKELAAMIELAPAVLPPAPKYEGPGTAVTEAERRARVILLAGCAQQVLRPGINDFDHPAAGAPRRRCRCGGGRGLLRGAHLSPGRGGGRHRLRQAQRRRLVEGIGEGPVDAIIVNASGCGTMVKDYGHLLRRDREYAARAARISELARDICEFVGSKYELGAPKRWSSLRVAYHAACSLQHGQRVVEEPRALLVKAGFSVVDIPESHICCGSAGTYNILQPELATELRDRKSKNIKRVKPDLVATGNIGCISQLSGHVDVPVVHTVELLDWAYGGPVPRGLEPLARFMTNVPEPKRRVEEFIEA